jgi:hypothetical protein
MLNVAAKGPAPASPTKIPQVLVPGRPTASPRAKQHSAAHPGAPGKMFTYLSTDQRKPGSGAGIRVLVLVVRGGVEPPTFRFSGGRSYQLSYLTVPEPLVAERRSSTLSRAVLTGLEPATSTLTGWRANRLLYRTMRADRLASGAPNGIRTRAAALKGRCPRPLDDGGLTAFAAVTLGARRRGLPQHRGQPACPAKRSQATRSHPATASRTDRRAGQAQDDHDGTPCAITDYSTR